jgi:glycosyltransferase involved in cell wall biosynthesis
MNRWWRRDDLRNCTQLTFTGWLTAAQMANWYERADVLVVPSWYEPFGMVLLEGMIHGLAIAAADVGGPSEILTHNTTGLLFSPRDVPALVDTLVQLLASPSLRHRLARAAVDEVRRSWAWPRIVQQVRGIYVEVGLSTEC